jgi:hypothetical protein
VTEWFEWWGYPRMGVKNPEEGKTYLVKTASGDIVKALFHHEKSRHVNTVYFHHIPEPGKQPMLFSRSNGVMHWAELPIEPDDSKWISIRKELPPEDTDILIYSKENGILKGRYVRTVVGESIWFSECFTSHHYAHPTHWMLLPKTPND